jgi:hypothetical protein
MQLLRVAVLLLAICPECICQDISELEKRHGFKDIRLDYPIDSVKGAKLKKEFREKDEFPAKLYKVEHSDYAKIGEVKVKEIEVKAYKDVVYEISVVADKDPRLMKALELLYGRADYDQKNETYFWKNENLSLKFRAQGKHHLQMLYTSYAVYRSMKDDKNKKVDDIADDF